MSLLLLFPDHDFPRAGVVSWALRASSAPGSTSRYFVRVVMAGLTARTSYSNQPGGLLVPPGLYIGRWAAAT